MMKKLALIVALNLVMAAAATVVLAAGGTKVQAPTPPREETRDPVHVAMEHYNFGIAARDKAWKFEAKAAAAANDADRVKFQKKAGKQYKRALKDFETATDTNPRFHEAYSSLGYTLRKTVSESFLIDDITRLTDEDVIWRFRVLPHIKDAPRNADPEP